MMLATGLPSVEYLLVLDLRDGVSIFDAMLFWVDGVNKFAYVTEFNEISELEISWLRSDIELGAYLNGYRAHVGLTNKTEFADHAK